MTAVPYDRIDTVFLDAGNTILSLDYEFIAGGMRTLGLPGDAVALARAEAAARGAVSRRIEAGASTGDPGTQRFWVAAILEHLGVETESRSDVLDGVMAWLARPAVWRRLWKIVPDDVPAALAALRAAGKQLVVVSNSDGSVAGILEEVGLRAHVDHVIDSAEVGVEKPDPAIFQLALDHTGTAPERCVHLGDIYSVDVLGARAAGIHGVLMDPFDLFGDHDCARVRGVGEMARAIV